MSEPADDPHDGFEERPGQGRRTPPSHPGSRARGSLVSVPLNERIALMVDRMDYMEEALAESANEYAAVGACARAWGITRRQAQKYLRAVKRRWQLEAPADREARRDQVRRKLRRTYNRAMNHHKPMTVGDGFGNQHVEYHLEPNEGAALKAVELEARLDGLMEQADGPVVNVTVRTEVLGVLERHYGAKAVPALETSETSNVPRLEDGDGP